jgi:hypothetical protein
MVAPFLLFAPSPYPCALAAMLFVALQAGIMAHGSFGHFNLLTAVLCVPLILPGACPSVFVGLSAGANGVSPSSALRWLVAVFYLVGGLVHIPFTSGLSRSLASFPQIGRWNSAGRRGFMAIVRSLGPFRLVHAYGVFPPHTAPGLKIVPVVEGSMDSRSWRRYQYRFMISSPSQPPRWCAPHQPRLDYRMFYEGIGTTPDNMMAGILALHEPYALSRAGFCDRLMERLLTDCDGPVAKLFGHNPFEGGKPPKFVRIRTVCFEPVGLKTLGTDWWFETPLGPNRPSTRAQHGALWRHYIDEPEVLHFDGVFHRARCEHHVTGTPCREGAPAARVPAPTAVPFAREHLVYDGTRPAVVSVLRIGAQDIAAFWRWVDACTHSGPCDWSRLSLCAEASRREHSHETLWRFELVLSRYTMQLAVRLAPLCWAPGFPTPTALAPPEGEPAVSSWFDLTLLCHHIISLGRDAVTAALHDPQGTLQRVWPTGMGRWDVVSAVRKELEPTAQKAQTRRRTNSPLRRERAKGDRADGVSNETLTVQRSALLYATLWWETLCWHGAKWRLASVAASPWRLATPAPDSGFMELVELIMAHCKQADDGDDSLTSERHVKLDQDDQLAWRDETGRRLGHGVASPARIRASQPTN